MTTQTEQAAPQPSASQRLASVLHNRGSFVYLAVALVGGAAFVAMRLNREWFPHDDGSFAQSASRVLGGQLPHRDFAELYTGGMTFLNAGVFWLVGENLVWLRIPMFLLFVAFLACFYAIARRFVVPPVACLVTLFAVAWSIPTYPAAVPSWYQLFFWTFGALCVIRHAESPRGAWLFAAGIFGGLAISFKIVGGWYVVAVLVYLVVKHIEDSDDRGEGHWSRGSTVALGGATTFICLAMILAVFRSHFGMAEVVNLLIPACLLCGIPFVAALRRGTPSSPSSLAILGVRSVMFLGGVAIPVVAISVPYLVTGSVSDLVNGVLVAPQSRLQYTYLATPAPAALLFAVPVVAALIGRRFVSPRLRWIIDVSLVSVAVVLLVTVESAASHQILWRSMRSLGPFVVVLGAAVVLWSRRDHVGDARRAAAGFLVLLAGFASLTQFPFGAPVYYCYVAPLVALAAVAVVGYAGGGGDVLPTALLAVFVVFGFIYADRARVGDLGTGFGSGRSLVILDAQRASILVPPEDRDVYQRITRLLREHAGGRYVFAGPDSPQVYFLSGFDNPTRALFDFLDTTDSARGQQLLRNLTERRVTAIAINRYPEFSQPLDATTTARLTALYPHHELVGAFDIRWSAR